MLRVLFGSLNQTFHSSVFNIYQFEYQLVSECKSIKVATSKCGNPIKTLTKLAATAQYLRLPALLSLPLYLQQIRWKSAGKHRV